MSPYKRPQKWATYIWIALFLCLPFVFHRAVYEGSHLPKLFIFQITLCILFLITLGHPTRLYLGAKKWRYWLGVYITLHVISIFMAINPIETTLQLTFQISILAIPIIVTTTLTKEQYGQIIRVIPWSGLPIAIIGLCQYSGVGFENIPSNAQPSATFFHRNAAAVFVICVFPLAWIGFQRAQNQSQTLLHSGLLLILGVFLVCTRTRAAWVGLVGAALITCILSFVQPTTAKIPLRKLKYWTLATLSMCIVFASFLPENIQGNRRIQFDEKKADATTAITSMLTAEGDRGRTDLWIHSLSMIYHHPLGVGLGNWQFQYPYFARGNHINVNAAPERPHNDLLWIATELGILGLFVFAWLLLLTLKKALYLLSHTHGQDRTLVQGLLMLLGAYLIDGLFSFPRGQVVPSLYFWFAMGGIFLFSKQEDSGFFQMPIWAKSLLIALSVLCIITTYRRIQYDIHHQKVHSAERRSDWNTVIREANLAHKIGTYRANTFIAQGRAFYRKGNLLEAEKAYKIGLKRHPHSLNAYNNLGIVYRQLGKNEQAEAAFRNALYYHPSFVEAFYNLGNVYMTEKRWQDAQNAYQEALQKGLDIPQLYFKLGQVAYIQGEMVQAKSYFQKTLQKDPQFTPAQTALAQLNKTHLFQKK